MYINIWFNVYVILPYIHHQLISTEYLAAPHKNFIWVLGLATFKAAVNWIEKTKRYTSGRCLLGWFLLVSFSCHRQQHLHQPIYFNTMTWFLFFYPKHWPRLLHLTVVRHLRWLKRPKASTGLCGFLETSRPWFHPKLWQNYPSTRIGGFKKWLTQQHCPLRSLIIIFLLCYFVVSLGCSFDRSRYENHDWPRVFVMNFTRNSPLWPSLPLLPAGF